MFMFRLLFRGVSLLLRAPLLIRAPLLVLALGLAYTWAPFATWANTTPVVNIQDPNTGVSLLRVQPLPAACILGQIMWRELAALL